MNMNLKVTKKWHVTFRDTLRDPWLQGYGYNLNWRGWGTSEYRFAPNRPSHWSLISTGEGMLTWSRVLCFDPVNIHCKYFSYKYYMFFMCPNSSLYIACNDRGYYLHTCIASKKLLKISWAAFTWKSYIFCL